MIITGDWLQNIWDKIQTEAQLEGEKVKNKTTKREGGWGMNKKYLDQMLFMKKIWVQRIGRLARLILILWLKIGKNGVSR